MHFVDPFVYTVGMDATFRAKYHHPFHTFWGQVVGHAKYNKKDWQALDNMLSDSWRHGDEVKAASVLTLARHLRDAQIDQNNLPE